MLGYDLLCLSHLRWDFVFQRPQHLLTRFARGRVFFFEEPVFGAASPHLDVTPRTGNVRVLVPHLPDGLDAEQVAALQAELLSKHLREANVKDFVRWYLTPASLSFTRHLDSMFTIYDCMDELSHFKGAPAALREQEKELFKLADLVFTGGVNLYNFKKDHHANVHAFPSSVDVSHFGKARGEWEEPQDQQGIPHPRVGFFGVLDERLDVELVRELAALRPDLHQVLIGPVCKIDQADLPQAPNIHYLGPKSYDELPRYLAGWDVAMMPFARNDATRFISPTKTPEYLAGGRPVVSTTITDVVEPYERLGLVRIADNAADFARAIDEALAEDPVQRTLLADQFLSQNSWDKTWAKMQTLIDESLDTWTIVPPRSLSALKQTA